MGLPIMVQLTESERNKTHAGDGYVMTPAETRISTQSIYHRSLHLPPGVTASHGAMFVSLLLLPLRHSNVSYSLYVGSLHFNLTESDIKQVFEPFGELEFVDLHRDSMTGRSKGYAFVQ